MAVAPQTANICELWEAIYADEDLALHAAMYAWTAARVPEGRVLDVGCQYGLGSSLITRSNPRLAVVGVDPDLPALGSAYGMPSRSQWSRLNGDGARLPVASAEFAGLYLINVLNLVQDPVAVLIEARRALKPGGTVVVGLTRAAYAAASERNGPWIDWLRGQLEQLFSPIVIPSVIRGRFASHSMSTFRLGNRTAPWLAMCTKD